MCPSVLPFDEPTSALDPELVGEVPGAIRNLAHEHDLSRLSWSHARNAFRARSVGPCLLLRQGADRRAGTADREHGPATRAAHADVPSLDTRQPRRVTGVGVPQIINSELNKTKGLVASVSLLISLRFFKIGLLRYWVRLSGRGRPNSVRRLDHNTVGPWRAT
jgi:ABC-type glutathione transport system ATPase component